MCDGYLAPTPPHSHGPLTGPKASKPLSRRALALAVRQLSGPGPSARLLSPSPYLGDDVACFDFFRFRLTTAINESRDSQATRGFWNSTLLQVSHTEPSVWHAVAALGALYRKWEVVSGGRTGSRTSATTGITNSLDDADLNTSSSTDDQNENNHGRDVNLHSVRLAEQAGMCYSKALTLAKSVRDPSCMLVLSLALAATANLSGRWADSSVHYQAGRKIMAQLRRDSRGKPMSDLHINAIASLAKLGLQLLSFNEQSVPYSCCGFEMNEVGVNSSGEPFPRSLVSAQDQRVWGLQRANIGLVDIIRRIMLEASLHTPVDQPTTRVDNSRKHIQDAIICDLKNWELEILRVLSTTTDPTHRTALDLLSIKLLHTLARLFLAVGVMDPDMYSELTWDTHLAYFDRMLTLTVLILRTEAQQNPMLLSVMSLDEPAINMVLWLTTVRCRHPVIRRRALQLLHDVRRLEGVWMSTSAAAAAARMVAIEEEEEVGLAARLPKWATVEPAIIAGIEGEDLEPRSWVVEGRWKVMVAAVGSEWVVPGEVLVPLERRITQVDVTAEYDAHVGRSRGDLTLIFAGRDEFGLLRCERVSVYF